MTGPDRIWIDRHGGNWSPVDGGTQDVEYIRRDPAVLAALPEAQALIAAAYEVAAKTADECRRSACTAGMGMEPVLAAIRAMTPADATAALAARDAAMRAEGLREAAEVAFGVTPYKRVRGEAGYSDLMCARSDGTWQSRKETQASILTRAAGIEKDAK